MGFEKVFYSYHAEFFRGTLQELTNKLEEINKSKDLSLGFITSPVLVQNSEPVVVESVIQVKKVIKGFRKRL
ncbi:MAG: hypothetical protein AABY22_17810 [Nanoarchaeota archaeon]